MGSEGRSLSAFRMLGVRRLNNTVSKMGVRRMGGGWIRTNVRMEENAGLREASYKTWEFDTTSVPRLLIYMIIPGTLFFYVAKDEMIGRSSQIGKSIAFGIAPTDSENP